MTIATTLIIVYLVSFIGSYKLVSRANRDKTFSDFLMVTIPVINSVIFFAGLICMGDELDWNKFFNRF